MTRSIARLTRRSPGRRGFTMLELAIALTLLGSVIFALNRFALGGLAASATNIEMADIRRQLAYTQQLIRADLSQARACDPTGYGTPLVRLDGVSDVKRFAVYTTATADGSVQLVEWRFYPDGTVYRISTTRAWDEPCDATIPLGILQLSSGGEPYNPGPDGPQLEILATARNVFNFRLSGTHSYLDADGSSRVERVGDHTGLCIGRSQGACYADTIEMMFITVTAGQEPVETRFEWRFSVELSNARM